MTFKKTGAGAILTTMAIGIASFLSIQVFTHSSRITGVETKQTGLEKTIDLNQQRDDIKLMEIQRDIKIILKEMPRK